MEGGWGRPLAKEFPDNFWKDRCYIADSAVISERAITRIRAVGMHWLGRLPARFTLCADLKRHAWEQPQESWVELGSV